MQNKKDFIRQQDPKLPASEVVKKGAEAGIKFSAAYVYVTRSNDRQKKPSKVSKKVEATVARILAKAGKEIVAAMRKG